MYHASQHGVFVQPAAGAWVSSAPECKKDALLYKKQRVLSLI